MLVLSDMHCCVSSCVTFLSLPRTEFGWYHPKIICCPSWFFQIGRCRWYHPQISASVGTRLDTNGKYGSGGGPDNTHQSYLWTLTLFFSQNDFSWVHSSSIRSFYLCPKNSSKNPHPAEAAGIIHNKLYSVNCVCITCRSKNITVLGSPQVSDERFLVHFFNTMYYILVSGKEAKIWFYIQQSMNTHELFLLLRAVYCSERAWMMWNIKINLVQ